MDRSLAVRPAYPDADANRVGRRGSPLNACSSGHAEGLHLRAVAVYLRAMVQRDQDRPARAPLSLRDLLEFHPWMLALAVFLACAIGIAIMEQVRDARYEWAQAAQAAQTQHP